ncbi:amino acid ABC transporter substrate-binding protein [Marinobacter panjinensis]|uniref:Amino acid ABC transporter substrate-binding protein n=1 Tax=Marinobacter panjinensis TaxID=2576384 RepID=A0A4U6QZA6_9GAMM|nr:transporter substrate-binding domain-containing protein [Marinobacter panjinensis]MCR8915461.1 transporter substrate-binding domain-containing protein [Marinobacter panjinensis]TKV66714.1 amino acid ABC transporter substrate-binding protein [Marinobacter panjinensis]
MRNASSSRRLPIILASLTLAFSVLSGTGVLATENAATQNTERVVRFNVSPNGYPPYLIYENGKHSGIMWEVVTAIAERLDYVVIPEQIPRKRVDQMIKEGYIDATTRAREWTDNPEEFAFTDPIVDIEEVLFVPEDSDLEFEVPEDLFSHTLVTPLGYHYPTLEPHFQAGEIRRFDVSRDKDVFHYVLHGDDMDAAVADRLVGKWILRNEDMQGKFRTTSAMLSQYGFRLMLRKDCTDFVESFNRELEAMKKNGELEEILSHYR